MRKYLFLIVAAAVAAGAYVLGAKAGRRRYRQITQTAESLWNDPAVKRARSAAKKRTRKAIDKAGKKLG